MPRETPAPPAQALAPALDISVEAGNVVVRGLGFDLCMTPEAAAKSAEALLEAAERAAGELAPESRKPPFPPANLVSPHGSG